MLVFPKSYFENRYPNFLSQIIGPEPTDKDGCEAAKPEPMDECRLQQKQNADQRRNHLKNNPWILFNEAAYRQFKSGFSFKECSPTIETKEHDFSVCEENLTQQERYKLKKALINWMLLGLPLALILLVSRKFHVRFRRWIEEKWNI